MAVVTISRGAFSGGDAIAKSLAALLNYGCIDGDELVERAAASGAGEKDLKNALLKAPGLLDRLTHRRAMHLAALQAALAEAVAGDNVIYHGNAGHLLLRGVVPALRVLITAPLESRIAMAAERLGVSRAEAEIRIARMDEERRKWVQFLYGEQWSDPALFDLVVNLSHAGIDEASSLIADMARLDAFVFTPAQQAAVRNFALANRVRVALYLDPGTTHLEVEVWARGGTVHIRGYIGSRRGFRETERVARQVPGVRELNLDELTVYAEY